MLEMRGLRKWKVYMYDFFERPKTKLAYFYHLLTLMLILGSALLSVLSTVEKYEKDTIMVQIMFYYEIALLVLFSLEYVTRMAVCDVNGKYKGLRGRLLYARSFYMLIDIFVIVTAIVTAVLQNNAAYFTVLRFARFFQIFRILRIDRSRGDLQTMWKVVHGHKKELLTCYFFCFIVLFLGSYIIYMCERTVDLEDGGIDNMVHGLYWGIITFTTVGYGDYSPQSWPGKILTALFALLGCAFFALPAGIIGSGFALQVSKQRKKRGEMKLRHPAAKVIQSAWRHYAINHKKETATWTVLFPQLNNAVKAVEEEWMRMNQDDNELSTTSDVFKNIFLQISDDAVLQRKKSMHTLVKDASRSYEELNGHAPRHTFRKTKKPSVQGATPVELMGVYENVYAQPSSTSLAKYLRPNFRNAMRFIVLLRMLATLRTFRDDKQPYVNIEEVMHQNNVRLVETLDQLKELREQFKVMMTEIKDLKQAMVENESEKGNDKGDNNEQKT